MSCTVVLKVNRTCDLDPEGVSDPRRTLVRNRDGKAVPRSTTEASVARKCRLASIGTKVHCGDFGRMEEQLVLGIKETQHPRCAQAIGRRKCHCIEGKPPLAPVKAARPFYPSHGVLNSWPNLNVHQPFDFLACAITD